LLTGFWSCAYRARDRPKMKMSANTKCFIMISFQFAKKSSSGCTLLAIVKFFFGARRSSLSAFWFAQRRWELDIGFLTE
jgi:hypothetical protein